MLDMTAAAANPIPTNLPKYVTKRSGDIKPFEEEKIKKALTAAWVGSGGASPSERDLARIINKVWACLVGCDMVSVEDIQDVVEVSLMASKKFEVAKAFILHRQQRAEARQKRTEKKPDTKALSSYIHAAKYAKYLPELQRREVAEETTARVEAMHIRKFPQLEDRIRKAFDLVREDRVLPSMRSLQFGGVAIEKINARIYNCSATLIDRMEAFSQAFFLLLCGCGVGFSVQMDHVEKLPTLSYIDKSRIEHCVIEDTIEGWADAAQKLLDSYLSGTYIEFSYHKIRPEGSPLVVSGGKAPGHRGLKIALERVREILDRAQGRKMRPVECHRIMCHLADAVLSGGVRRSSLISLFSFEDSEMLYLKTGNWFPNEPWLANANNSVVLKRDDVKKKQFKKIFQMTRQWGEPGFYFTNSYDYATNPCAEIGLNPVLVVDELVKSLAEKKGIPLSIGERYTGFSFCNLCELNASKFTSLEDFLEAAEAATFIGTLQASYTDLPYLGWVSELIAERDALLGIGMTGIMDAPEIALNPEYQRIVANKVKEWNAEVAKLIGIQPAARTTTVKPSGTSSLRLGCVGSGIHFHHGKRYFRRVTANENEPVFQYFRKQNPHMCVRKPNGDSVIEFVVEAPEGAKLKTDYGAIEFLDMVKSTQVNWVQEGTARTEHSPGLSHNVSNTVEVKPEEWDKVCEYLWDNRDCFTGVSFLPSSGDKDYAFAPMERISTPGDEARWNAILENYTPVDYSLMVEEEDTTNLKGEGACIAGACEVK